MDDYCIRTLMMNIYAFCICESINLTNCLNAMNVLSSSFFTDSLHDT